VRVCCGDLEAPDRTGTASIRAERERQENTAHQTDEEAFCIEFFHGRQFTRWLKARNATASSACDALAWRSTKGAVLSSFQPSAAALLRFSWSGQFLTLLKAVG